jgi:hypothetical protein
VRGGTYFLCRRKESKQRKRAATASQSVSTSRVNPEWSETRPALALPSFVTKDSFIPSTHYVRAG